MEWREKAFVLPTIALICFGSMGYFLGELCGSYMDEWPICSASSVLSSLWYDKYLLLLAVSIVAGVLLFRGMTFLCKANDRRRWVRNSLAVILAIFNIFMATACIAASIDTDDLHPIYEGSDVAWYGATILYTILTAIAGYIGIAVKNLYEKYVNDKTKKDVVKICVKAVEQIYTDLHGEEKLNMCIDSVVSMLGVKGISVTDIEVRMLIEAAVAEFNDAFHKGGDENAEDTAE